MVLFFFVVAQVLHDFKTDTILVYMILNGEGVRLVVVYMDSGLLFPFFFLTCLSSRLVYIIVEQRRTTSSVS